MDKQPIRVLLADDDEADRLLFTEALEELNLNVIIESVIDGVQLMDHLNTANTTLPNILFLDLNMPRKNGMECLKEIRANKSLADLPVAIYSTSSSETDIEKTFLNGANVYINKPNDFNELKEVLEKALKVMIVYQSPPFNKENFLLRI